MGKSEQGFSDPKICVFQFEDGWTVASCGGHYAIPLTKDEALYEARKLADESNLAIIALRNREGKIDQLLPVESLPTSPASHCGICKGTEKKALGVECSCVHREECVNTAER